VFSLNEDFFGNIYCLLFTGKMIPPKLSKENALPVLPRFHAIMCIIYAKVRSSAEF